MTEKKSLKEQAPTRIKVTSEGSKSSTTIVDKVTGLDVSDVVEDMVLYFDEDTGLLMAHLTVFVDEFDGEAVVIEEEDDE